jgi:hypothetical protein
VALAEEVLDRLKAARAVADLQEWTMRLARWQKIEGAELVCEYRWRRDRYPSLTAGLLLAARHDEQARQRAILAYLQRIGSAKAAA